MKKVLWVCVLVILVLFLFSFNLSGNAQQQQQLDRITQLARKVHGDYRSLVTVRRLNIPAAVQEQQKFLLEQPEVQDVVRLKGSNLMVRFKDGNELLMFLGEERLGDEFEKGGGFGAPPPQVQQNKLQRVEQAIVMIRMPCATNSNKALIFDCLEDDYNVISPKIWQQVKSNLETLGYTCTVYLNNSANLANAALIDDGEYGVVFLRGHGGDLGGDFGFLVRPWYTSYPPANSGYTGTIRASAYCAAAGQTQFGYVFTGTFSSTYWTNKTFPASLFFLESCHGADPGALPGMPTWTINHGASVWIGWNESVSFNCGDNGSKLFFEKMKDQKNVDYSLGAVYATGCRPPELVSHPSGKGSCRLSIWISDPNEASSVDSRDFKLVKLIADSTNAYVRITFYAVPNFNEFFLYADTGGSNAAEIAIKCHMNNFEIYTQTGSGVYGNKVFTGTPSISGNNYSLTIPWATAFGTINTVKFWLYDMTSQDRAPDSGSAVLKK
ncbi:MAG: hypothetical protein PHU81_04485 [Acidobacteriota bacterium]|nr:hypothetical protein [Acidobacteriota bacterium]